MRALGPDHQREAGEGRGGATPARRSMTLFPGGNFHCTGRPAGAAGLTLGRGRGRESERERGDGEGRKRGKGKKRTGEEKDKEKSLSPVPLSAGLLPAITRFSPNHLVSTFRRVAAPLPFA